MRLLPWSVIALGGLLLSGCQLDRIAMPPSPDVVGDAHPPFGSYLAGRYARSIGDHYVAVDFLESALADDPDNINLLHRAYLHAVSAGRMADSLVFAKHLEELRPGATQPNIRLAVEGIVDGDLDGALAALERSTGRGVNRFVAPLLEGWIHAAQGDLAAAKTAMQPLADTAAFLPMYNLHLGLMAEMVGDVDAANAAFTATLAKLDRVPARLAELIGGFYERNGAPDKAEALYKGLHDRAPNSLVAADLMEHMETGQMAAPQLGNLREATAEALYHFASVLRQDRALDLALVYGRLALYLNADFAESWVLVGDIESASGRPAEAIIAYERVSPASPLYWAARLRVTTAYRQLGEEAVSVALLHDMAAERPERTDALVQLGDLLRSEERFSEAVAAYDEAVARLPQIEKSDWSLLYSRGIALERSKQWKRAEQDFLQALELQPDQPYVLNYLGYSWVDQGINIDRARSMIERAVELQPDDGYIVDSLGWVFYRLGQHEEAVRQLERAVELRPQDPIINDHLGDALWMVGRTQEARFQWLRARNLDPDPDLLATINKKLRRGLAEAPHKPERDG